MSTKISALTAISSIATSDVLPIVDVSEAITKKITLAQLLAMFAPTTPENAVVYTTGSAFAGAANASISDGNLAIGAAADDLPDLGDLRIKANAFGVLGFNAMQRDGTDTKNLGLIQTWSEEDGGDGPLSFTPNSWSIGTDAWSEVSVDDGAYTIGYLWASRQLISTLTGSSTVVAGLYPKLLFTQLGSTGTDDDAALVVQGKKTNFMLEASRTALTDLTDLGGAEGGFFIGPWNARPTTGAGNGHGIVLGVDSSSRAEYVRPNGEWVPLWDGPQIENSTTGNQSDVPTLDDDDLPASGIRFTGESDVTIRGLTDGREGRRIELWSSGTADLVLAHESGSESTAANRIATPTAADITVLAGETVSLKYDSVGLRWRVIGVGWAGVGG